MKADLHVHSVASDGTLTSQALVELALREGLDVLAIADHDSVEGVENALAAAQGTSLTVVPAVELSATGSAGQDVHILGFFVDVDHEGLRSHLTSMRAARQTRAEAMVRALSEGGYHVPLEDVERLAAGGAIGRSHIARVLVSGGHAADVAEAFDRLIGRGKEFYVSKASVASDQVISCIRSAGGIAVLAHPGVTGADDLIETLASEGLGGIEAFHADHTPWQREHYRAMAESMGLLVTGGSDFHGPGAPNPPLGSIPIPEEYVRAFMEAGRAS